MTKQQSNAVSYDRLLQELKQGRPYLHDVFFSEHLGQWSIQFESSYEDVLTFEEVLDRLDQLDANYRDYLQTLEERPAPGPLSLEYYCE